MAIVVSELNKTYKGKKGVSVHALKGISFNLPDMGMVFILGKSGCGKSTLLNVLGGLDGFDSGDVIVDGKSIKGYKLSELDVYRNKYVGFVFQENHLFEKESITRNVALALELQNEKDTVGRTESAIASVGLEEIAGRRCNRISGGQKQRVAIARALVKEPKLLLCDEPTGALDSETGEEIFTLLKGLSKDRLVVVVSHDRESAEKYGDRVIELKDGKIISDSAPIDLEEKAEEKTAEQQAEASDGVPAETTETNETAKKKRGGLRFARAFKMGAGYVISKPIRMAICLFLCLITFTCVGTVYALSSYDRAENMLYSMDALGSKCYSFCKAIKSSDRKYAVHVHRAISTEEAEELCSYLDVDRTDYIYNFGNGSGPVALRDTGVVLIEDQLPNYARTWGYVEADEKFLQDYGFTLLAGRLPENTGEVVLPEYLFNHFKTYGYKTDDKTVAINSYEDLIGKTINITNYSDEYINGSSELAEKPLVLRPTVTGIVDTHFVYEKQADVLFNGAPIYGNDVSGTDFSLDMEAIEKDIIHNTLFVSSGFNDYFDKNFGDYRKDKYGKEYIARVIAPYKGSDGQKLKNIRIYEKPYHYNPVSEGNDYYRCYHLLNYVAQKTYDAEDLFSYVREYAAYGLWAVVLISVLFLMYYASGTIDEKRREIGILRALGASHWDILKIFASEHGIFTAAEVTAASVASAILIAVINSLVAKSFGFGIMFVRFGIGQIAVVLGVALLSIIAGIAFPLVKLLKAKPVDVIADRK